MGRVHYIPTTPNNPVEPTAHSGSFFPCVSLYLWAAAHRERWAASIEPLRKVMEGIVYKFVTVEGKCSNPYDIGVCEKNANKMAEQGFDLVQVYQTTSATCGGSKSVLVMVFRKAA